MKFQISQLVKIVVTVFILGALGLECWNIYLHGQNASMSQKFSSALWLGHIVLFAHSIEALIAASQAKSKGKQPLLYGIYTFFVGFPALQELANDS